jgi:hypothetical protein
MKWTWEVLERLYLASRVNIASLSLTELLNANPACLRAMVNEYRADKGGAPVDPSSIPDGKEVDEVISDFFGLATPKAGPEKNADTGVTPPIST